MSAIFRKLDISIEKGNSGVLFLNLFGVKTRFPRANPPFPQKNERRRLISQILDENIQNREKNPEFGEIRFMFKGKQKMKRLETNAHIFWTIQSFEP